MPLKTSEITLATNCFMPNNRKPCPQQFAALLPHPHLWESCGIKIRKNKASRFSRWFCDWQQLRPVKSIETLSALHDFAPPFPECQTEHINKQIASLT